MVHQIQVTSEAAALEEVGSHYWLSNEKIRLFRLYIGDDILPIFTKE